MKSEEERKNMMKNMCVRYMERMMVMFLLFIVGIIIDIHYQGTGCLIAWMIWLIMFISLLLLTDIKENDKFEFRAIKALVKSHIIPVIFDQCFNTIMNISV